MNPLLTLLSQNLLIPESSDPIATFTSSLISISEKCIPKTSTNPKKSNPWYNDDCKEAIKQRKQTLSKFCKFPTNENLNTYRNSRAKARQTIKSGKRKSWRTYVSKLNYKTPTKKVWDMVRKISGKTKTATYQHLNTNFNNGSELASTKARYSRHFGITILFKFINKPLLKGLSKIQERTGKN